MYGDVNGDPASINIPVHHFPVSRLLAYWHSVCNGPSVGSKTLVQVKDVTIQELPPTPGSPTWKTVGFPKVAKPNAA
jgi:hypothetical protein